ncbi:MAG: choice-of-anchor J domain-containing protein, partial [Chitinophagales bacterium]
QTLGSFECWMGLDMYLEDEQNDSNDSRTWFQPLRNPFAGYTLSVDFQGFSGTKPLGETFPGWWEAVGADKPVEEDSQWEVVLSSDRSMKIEYLPDVVLEDWIVSPVFVPQSNTEFRFSFGISSSPKRNLGGDDVLEVMVSTDCLNFEPLYVYDSSYVHPPMIDPVSINDLSDYAGQEIIVAIRANSKGTGDKSAYLALDDIYIGPALDTDISENPFEEDGGLKVFPNPSEGLFYLDWGHNRQLEEDGEVVVTNTMGQVVYRATLSSLLTNSNNGRQAVIDASDWEEGVYLLLWRYGNQSHSQKLVKMGR